MFRREVLQGIAGVGVTGILAGCGEQEPDDQESQKPPEEPASGGPTEGDSFAVVAIDYREDDSGNLVVLVTVENGGQESRSGTLRTTVGVGGETLTESTDLTVAAGESEDVEVPFEASFEEFEEAGSIDLDLE
jgi:hypothetical protein